jgi:hypothetical protein
MAYGPWSEVKAATTSFHGTWIYDPADPAGTIISFAYGGVGRQESRDRAKTAMQFAGRTYPVYDVGEARAHSVSVAVQVNGEEEGAAALIERARKLGQDATVILYRDGRGRRFFGMISDFTQTDLEMGSAEISFLVNRAHYDEALPGVT